MKKCFCPNKSTFSNLPFALRNQDYKYFFSIKALTQLCERFCSRMCVSKIVTDSTCKLCLCRNKSKISPFALFHIDFGPFFAGVFGVIVLLFIIRVQIFGDFPEFLRA